MVARCSHSMPRALSSAVEIFKEITVVAPPGTGKTTTLLQVVEAVISRGNSVGVFVPLGEWSSQSDSLLQSVVWGQETPEPNLIVPLRPDDSASVRQALAVIETLMQVLVLAVRIKSIIES
jgi:Cdc6-like AAA superfamily ATPase